MRILNKFLNSKLFYDINTKFLFMEILLLFIKSISIFNEMNHNLKCSEQMLELALKGAYLTKNSRKI